MNKNHKTISVLHTEWSDGWGGQEIRTISEMLLLRDRGVEVCLSSKANGRITSEAENHGIPTIVLPFRGMLDFGTMFCLRRIIKERSIDIINTHSGKDTWVGGVAAKMGGAKFIRTRHLANPINPSRFNFINELADHVITTGDTVRDAMIRDNRIRPERITSIPTMPDHRKFSPDNYSRTDERKRLGLKEDQVAVGIVGVLRRVKRHDLFLEMAQAILNECPVARFVIAGDGPLADDLRRMVRLKGMEEVVNFTGHLENPGSVMAALDVYVQTSDSETTTQTVPQALLMGLPIVSTDVGSVRQNYRENNFILVEPDNVERLVQAVGMLIHSRKARKGYAAGARASVPSDYSAEKMAENVLGIYNRLLASR